MGARLGVVAIGLLVLSGCGSDSDSGGVAGGGGAGGGTGGGGGISGGNWGGNGGQAGNSGAAGAATGGAAGSGAGGAGNTGGSGNTGNTGGTGNSGGTGGSGNTGNTGGSGGGFPNPICLQSQAGAYCGNDSMQGADPNVLYQCPGANQAPTSSTPCANGCVVEQQGIADHCKAVTSPNGYRLPWKPGVTMQLTQDCNDSCCNDHVADDGYAWDWANGTAFTVVAARGGTITHLKINSTTGCGNSSCVDSANFIVIDHGDGTQSVYLHLGGMTLAAGVSCGAAVQQGQALAKAGTTGWSTGLHLHFQVGKVHSGAATCECGSAGTGCAAGTVPWGSFWSTPTYPTLPIQFDEWGAASSCANRRITMPASQNQ
ncbi:MAG: M23 family metallopeptidase [Myxococcales bacterium]|nr:M23 family metallopeptidase [Myxococcales bacterium]MCB9580903.1 M23 family metallopeptidase [Polyangiaceae bacterium]